MMETLGLFILLVGILMVCLAVRGGRA